MRVNIAQVQSFRLFDRRGDELKIVTFERNTFAQKQDSFKMEKTTQRGRVIHAENVTEEFAKTVLEQALICLPKDDLEITKRSTGTQFNYPIKHI